MDGGAWVEIAKVAIPSAIGGGGIAGAFSAWLNRSKTAARAEHIVADTERLEQQLRLAMTSELGALHMARRTDQERIERLEHLCNDLQRRLDACEQHWQAHGATGAGPPPSK